VSPCREDARPSPQHETDPSVFDAARPTAHDEARRRRDGGQSAGRDRWLGRRDVLGELLYGDAADLDRLMIGIFVVVGAGVFALCGAILAVLYSVRR
jgi:hypothetical protein